MIARLFPALSLALAFCFAPAAFAQDSGAADGSDGSDGSDDTTFDEGTSVETYDVEEQKGCSVVAGSAALGATALSALVVVGRRRD